MAALPPTQASLSLEEQVARLQALLEASRQVHSNISVDLVLAQTAQILVRELELEGTVFLSPDSQQVMAEYGSPLARPFDGCTRFPLLAKDETVLAELVVKTAGGCDLSLYEEDFIQGLVLQAAVALENATYHERKLQWARVQQDLDAARGIQQSLLPASMPTIPDFSVAARSSACYEVGGDYLDTLQLPDGSHLLIVADVAGKGLASAIMATSFRAAFRSLAGQPITLLDMVSRINQLHWEEGSEARRRYVTAIFARLDLASARIEVVNAGHNPGILVLPDGTARWIEASGTPLGLLPMATYAPEWLDFPPGSKLLLYTDGLTEVFCGEEEFGCERLTELFRTMTTTDAEAVIDGLWEELTRFSTGGPQTDDMTALAVCHRDSASQEAMSR